MTDNLGSIHYWPIHIINYSQYFQEIPYNGKILSAQERSDLVAFIDGTIKSYSEGLPLIHRVLECDKENSDEFKKLDSVVNSCSFFVLITMIDILVASKYFLIADRDYDKRFLRGKLMVILNEGFKKLYGFNTKNQTTPEWMRLKPFLFYFPEIINEQYWTINSYLEILSNSSTWWKSERDNETHILAEQLYISRNEDVIECKVMMDSMKLFNALDAVNLFLSNAHACITNHLVDKYKKGEITE